MRAIALQRAPRQLERAFVFSRGQCCRRAQRFVVVPPRIQRRERCRALRSPPWLRARGPETPTACRDAATQDRRWDSSAAPGRSCCLALSCLRSRLACTIPLTVKRQRVRRIDVERAVDAVEGRGGFLVQASRTSPAPPSRRATRPDRRRAPESAGSVRSDARTRAGSCRNRADRNRCINPTPPSSSVPASSVGSARVAARAISVFMMASLMPATSEPTSSLSCASSRPTLVRKLFAHITSLLRVSASSTLTIKRVADHAIAAGQYVGRPEIGPDIVELEFASAECRRRQTRTPRAVPAPATWRRSLRPR